MLNQILATYASLLDWHIWKEVLSNPESWGIIFSLAILECLLSTDNALVLSAFVKPLPEKQQKKALIYGLWGAYIFRFILIGIGVYLINLWFIKLLGALYLMWLSVSFFYKKYFPKNNVEAHEEHNVKGGLVKVLGLFWATVISVELMDLTFSIDSILAALAVSNEVWIVMIGGMIGILFMRGVATIFISLMDRIAELETTAYILILFIGIKMLLTLVHYEIPNIIFISFLVSSFVVTFIVHHLREVKLKLGPSNDGAIEESV